MLNPEQIKRKYKFLEIAKIVELYCPNDELDKARDCLTSYSCYECWKRAFKEG